ncbi:hypothetical protein A9Q99_23200 [Gammaproteobacteria bacterium 45_16_T64]|nr:hypothetical protein A9Q99_23200 [Gammaproteobacteria bacterium 45_16_T64]
MAPSERRLLLINSPESLPVRALLEQDFIVTCSCSVDETLSLSDLENIDIIFFVAGDGAECPSECARIRDVSVLEGTSLVVYCPDKVVVDSIVAFNAGVDDIVDASMADVDIAARLQKEIFHRIANEQLKSRLRQANDMVFSAMSDTSDLGANVQFLLHCHECENLDELVQLLFRSLLNYQIKCSLQIRSDFEIKNVEENGLSKDLESRLLWELKDDGRYIDFGRRCIINYGCVSLLVKNMPTDEKRYSAVKDNVVSMVQGMDARVHSIDGGRMLAMEKEVMEGLSRKMQHVVEQVDEGYQTVMSSSAELVESMSAYVEDAMVFLDLTEQQEEVFSKIMADGVTKINKLFNQGVKIDTSFRRLISQLNTIFEKDGHMTPDELQNILAKL